MIICLNLVYNVIALAEYSDFTHFNSFDFIPAPCDVTTVLDPRHQNTITWPMVNFREFSPTFKPLIICLNLVYNANALAGLVIFTHCDALDFIPAPWDVTTVLDPRHTLTWPLAEYSDFHPYWRPCFIPEVPVHPRIP